MESLKKIKIYTDGACSGNPGPGGYGAVLIYGDKEKIVSGGMKDTTNNRMELLAVIEALKVVKINCDVEIYSDSAYVVNAFEKKWIQSWIKNGWKTADKKPVKNVELWQDLVKLLEQHKYIFIKVKGHSDNKYNNMCDEIARGEILKLGE